MPHTYEELRKMTLASLRDVAKELDHEAVQGYSQMNKDHLLPALCKALGIDTHEHHTVVGVDKAAIKAKMRELKRRRDEILASDDRTQLKAVRRHIHRLNHQLRSHVQ
jgi:DNA-binding IclR family transcriptional regulator